MVRAGIAGLVFALASCRPGSTTIPEARADGPAAASGGVAVVELFTSEGCSSCPPADGVLGDFARSTNRSVYALAFHVDYWDDLGWPDRFASRDFTARQQAYAGAFGSRGLYTPQMIVDGTEQFTGSDRDRAGAAVAGALGRPASVPLRVQARDVRRDAVTVDYEAPGAPEGCSLNVALVEASAITAVRSGENAGKTLHHVNVVRAFVAAPLGAATGSVVIRLPERGPRGGVELIAYVQRARSDGSGMPVLGAARASVVLP
jgi:hypothetical protein